MEQKALVLKFWNKEAEATRKVIARIPDGSDYRPDPKSRTARDLAWLIVREEAILAEGLANGVIVWTEDPTPGSVKEILDYYDRHHADAARTLESLEPATWERDIAFTFGGNELYRGGGYEHAWITLFDQIHHRGQLSTYLRPMGSTVPQIYGPSADEPM